MSYLSSLIDGIPSLASHAGVLNEVEAILGDSQCTLANVGEVIEKDPSLTARLLKLGNSSFFGFSQRLETVSETISLIGIQQVQDLIMASVVLEIFDGISPELVCMEMFWKHSLACGVAARLLAMAHRESKPEKFFVAGLLHDIGRLVLFSRDPEKARAIFRVYQEKPMLLREAEVAVLGFDHTDIAEILLRGWNYPANMINAVRYHHHPMSAGTYQMDASIVHVADFLINAMQLGSSGEKSVPPLNNKAWDRLNLDLDVIDSTMGAVDEQIEAVEAVFLTTRPAGYK